MGGRVGLKGTDGVVARALELGAEPRAHLAARQGLGALRGLLQEARELEIDWLTCAGSMGADVLRAAGFARLEICYRPSSDGTTGGDTRAAVERFLDRVEKPELVLFCGGDGTARDVCGVVKRQLPILGIPAGVKMYSGVFGVSAVATARLLFDYLCGRVELAEVDVLDLDEERYRAHELVLDLYDVALTPQKPSLTQAAKAVVEGASDSEAKEEIAAHVVEQLNRDADGLVLLGAGSTVAAIARRLGVDGSLLGIDAVVGGELVGRDLNERQLLELLDHHPRCRLVLSPLGAAGFVLGRGNQQLSPEVLRRIGSGNLIVAATPAKLQRTPALRFDTGDAALDERFAGSGYLAVVTGYHLRRLVRVEKTT
jgi:predicted polyphosphate/ATP-dependent NAD kinase